MKIHIGWMFLLIILSGCGGSGGSADTNTNVTPASPTETPVVPQEPETFEPIDPKTVTVGHPFFNSPHSKPIVASSDFIYVVNTPSDTVDVIHKFNHVVTGSINVGVDPVSLALRPDGKELWVSNHVSDSISIIDTDLLSPTFHQIIATIQDFDTATRSTRFDEPVGIAFASNEKAYVALSSLDKIAVIDVSSRLVTKNITINAQDPRAITVRDGRLFVTAFESNNQTELSGCFGNIDGDQCTFSLQQHVVNNNNVLSLNYDADIVKDPRVPDRDLFVYDTNNETLIDVVSGVGTLLYGLAVDSEGMVYIAQTDARNHINGRAGSLKQTLTDLDNRAFLNQIGVVNCIDANCASPGVFELEPLPPEHPSKENALATPFAIVVSDDNKTLIATAASSNRLFSVDAKNGTVLGSFEVGAVPRGIALQSNADGKPELAWVFNAVDNSVTVVDLSSLAKPELIASITLQDDVEAELKLGRTLFNSASASSTATFSCESCHPDGHTDQLLWVLGGPKCLLSGCDQIPVRSTMPIRGVRDTAPYHWDGVPGDPFGGRNGESPNGNIAPNCTDPLSCVVNLIDGGMASTMCDQLNCPVNDEGKAGLFTALERRAMGAYLLHVPPTPARERPFDDKITEVAKVGFDDFFIKDASSSVAGQTCGSAGCHAMPFWNGTNISGSGMDAPSFRGIQDRWLVLPQGRVNMVELYGTNGAKGFDEKDMWLRIISGTTEAQWQMFLEASMGYSGSFARQITLNSSITMPLEANLEALFSALEKAAEVGAVSLVGEGTRIKGDNAENSKLNVIFAQGKYWDQLSDDSFTREQLISEASEGKVLLTLTGHSGSNVGIEQPQPEIWSTQDMFVVRLIDFPIITTGRNMRLKGRHIGPNASLYVDGQRVQGTVSCESGILPECVDEIVILTLDRIPPVNVMHLVQVQNDNGRFSNEYIFRTF
jgi:DNA-binding beta-propeller fold protein YncE